MRGETEHHVIDEKLVAFGRPAQRLQQRCADMADHRIVMADAEFAGEIADAGAPDCSPRLSSAERGI